MAGAPAGFADLMNRKYDILQQTASSEAALRAAQGQGILGALPSENAQRQAQAFATTQQGKTVDPLAQASIASTYAGIPTQQAQAGLLGAQTRLAGVQADELGFNTSAPASDAELLNHRYQTMTNNGFGLSAGEGLPVGSLTPVTGTLSADRLDPNDPRTKIRSVGGTGYAAGTANVQPQGKAKGAAKGAPPAAPVAPGGMTMHEVMAHAMGSLHAAGGATTVPSGPGPGQTITNGSWEGPTNQPAPPPPAPVLPAPGPRPFGKRGISAAGGATTVRSVPSPETASEENRQANFALDPGQQMARNVGLFNDSATRIGGGAHYAKGVTKVPAKGGKSGVDSIPATLAPREAVLNEGAADHMGRGAIAALNALGAAKMAAQGTPPQTPPTAHGVMAPARGAPKAKPAMAKGAPPAKTKVAAQAGRK